MLNALDVTVAGLMTTGVQELDTRFLKIHLASAQRLLGTDGCRISSSAWTTRGDGRRSGALAAALAATRRRSP